MTNEEFFDIGRVAYITGNVQEALAAKQALETVVENANSLQQLKSEIRVISDIIEEYGDSGVAVDFPMLKRKLRELSAV